MKTRGPAMHKQKTDSKTYCAEKNASRLYDKRHAASRKSERKGSPPAVKARAYNAYTVFTDDRAYRFGAYT